MFSFRKSRPGQQNSHSSINKNLPQDFATQLIRNLSKRLEHFNDDEMYSKKEKKKIEAENPSIPPQETMYRSLPRTKINFN